MFDFIRMRRKIMDVCFRVLVFAVYTEAKVVVNMMN